MPRKSAKRPEFPATVFVTLYSDGGLVARRSSVEAVDFATTKSTDVVEVAEYDLAAVRRAKKAVEILP